MRILVAEDERDLNRLICQTLERAGYSVDTCYDGEAALDNLLGAEYDCLLLDIMMPKKDGHAVLRAVRAQGSTCLLYTSFQAVGQLGHGQFHALFVFRIRGLGLERTLKVVIGGEKRGHRAADRVRIRLLALTLAALAEVVVFRRHAEIAVIQLLVFCFPVFGGRSLFLLCGGLCRFILGRGFRRLLLGFGRIGLLFLAHIVFMPPFAENLDVQGFPSFSSKKVSAIN